MADEQLSPIGKTFSDFKSEPQPQPPVKMETAPSIPSQRFNLNQDDQITGSSEEPAPLFNPLEAVGRRLKDLMTLPEDAGDQGETVVKDKEGNDYLVDYRIDRNHDGTGQVTLTDKRLVQANADLAKSRAAISAQKEELKIENAELVEQAIFDKLTGVLNRRGIELEGDKFLQQLKDSQGQGLAIMLDLDHFKHTNDTYGHDTGDIVLREFAQVLKTILRPDDLVGRWGGEEFVVFLKTPQDREKITEIAERIRKAVEEHIFDKRHAEERKSEEKTKEVSEIRKTVSMGLARFDPPFNQPTLEGLIRQADQSLYAVKNNGRNGFAFTANGTTMIYGANGKVTMIPTQGYA